MLHLQNWKNIGKIVVVLFLLTFFTGCGSDSESLESEPTPSKTGVFLDHAVQGLTYQTSSEHGITDNHGSFKYRSNERVTFSIGGIALGETVAKETLTPLDLVPGAVDERNHQVTNICRLLQTLDDDANPNNGITITETVRNLCVGMTIRFDVLSEAFDSQSGVASLLSVLNTQQAFSKAAPRVLVSVETARFHMRNTLAAMNPSETFFPKFQTSDELAFYLKEQYANSVLYNKMYLRMSEQTDIPIEMPNGTGYTETNVQEQGVDESDTVKTDGTHLFIAGQQNIFIVKTDSSGSMAVIGTIAVPGIVNSLYWYNHVLAILYIPVEGAGEPWSGSGDPDDANVGIPDWIPIKSQTGMLFADVTEPENPVFLKNIVADGYLISSRLTDGILYVIQQFLPELPSLRVSYDGTELDKTEAVSFNRSALTDMTLDELIPSYRILNPEGLVVSSGALVSPENLYRPVEPEGGSIVTILSFDPDDPSIPFKAIGMVADAHTIYASTRAIYLTATRWLDPLIYPETEQPREQTVIYKFALNDGTAVSAGSGVVPGYILNPFSLSEYDNVLRIATSTGNTWWENPTSANHVYCLSPGTKGLEIIGRVEDLAPGETIYSARFIGTKGYLITYRTVDPLFTLDLSIPKKPEIAGELKIPGYATYLHPVGDDYLITIGKDVTVTDDGLWYQGVQLSFFDIRNFEDPKLLHKEIIGVRGTESEALSQHKAFTFWAENNLLTVPVSLCEHTSEPTMPSDFGKLTFSGLFAYRITPENGFVALGRISTTEITDPYPYFSGWTRGIFINGYLFTVRKDAVFMDQIDQIGVNTVRLNLE